MKTQRHRLPKDERTRVSLAPYFLLGLVLPIDTVTGVPPILFDLLRYGLAIVIVLSARSRPRGRNLNTLLSFVTLLLMTSGALAIVKSIVFDSDLFTGAVAFVSPLAAFLVVRKMYHHRWIMLGFVAGCALSAIDIILQVNGLPYLGVPSDWGFRYSGFSFSSTKVAPFLAVALCVVITRWAWAEQRAVLRVLLATPLLVALFFSQGRVGVAGLLAALTVFGLTILARRPLAGLGLLLVGIPALHFSGVFSALLDYVLRSDVPGVTDLSSGRGIRNSAAWDAFSAGGLLGVDPATRQYLNPHIAPLTSGVDVGPFGFFATSVVCLFLAYMMFFASKRIPMVFRMIAAVALATAFIEPNGFFVGFSGTLLVALCFAQFAHMGETSNGWAGPAGTAARIGDI
ncbi:hypothetical protein [Microbacterium sp. OR16]|uniref:hypothetical protein n=1 Tax=Microbacterium sp. OR16 TaxID=3095345 RepID=UPI0039B6CE82